MVLKIMPVLEKKEGGTAHQSVSDRAISGWRILTLMCCVGHSTGHPLSDLFQIPMLKCSSLSCFG